jgi:hypothetical protein
MAMGPEVPEVPGVPRLSARRGLRPDVRSVAWFVSLLAGSVLLGLLGGVIWGEFAPRAVLQEVGSGTAEVVNAETRAFFGADVWFAAIGAVAGLLTGVLGYRFAVAPRSGLHRAAVAAALILGALGGGLVMMWLGEQFGLSAYNQHLASSPNGTLFNGSLALGAKTALAIWPLFTALVLVIAEWGGRPGAPEPDRPAAPEPEPDRPPAPEPDPPGAPEPDPPAVG